MRVVAPIPGKDTIGVEVPNQERMMVFLRELLETHGPCEDKAIPLFLGKDVAGAPIVEDVTVPLRLAPGRHLLLVLVEDAGGAAAFSARLSSPTGGPLPATLRAGHLTD